MTTYDEHKEPDIHDPAQTSLLDLLDEVPITYTTIQSKIVNELSKKINTLNHADRPTDTTDD